METPENDTKSADEEFDDLIRRSAPYVRPPDQHREILRMILRSKIQQQKRRTRLLTGSLVTIIAAFGLFQLTNVGSDGFDLVPSRGPVLDFPVAEAPFAGDRIAHPDRGKELSSESLLQLRSVYEQKSSKQYELLSVNAWTVSGQTIIFLNWEAIVDGKPVQYSDILTPPDREVGLQFSKFLAANESSFYDRIEEGTARISGRETIAVEGIDIQFTKWSSSFPEWGEVIFWDGKPVR
ncbi:MAG: hypothetical protein KOO63_00450 [Bacteroidales bacterium]|nr:hypothetical protein [Candidatus Latescibacterota bacterium]